MEKHELMSLYMALPRGGLSEIIKRSKYTESYVRDFFKGLHEVTSENQIIIEISKTLINENPK